jgi:hypothetical protein
MGATSRNAVLGKAWRLGLRPRVKFTELARNPHAKRIRKRRAKKDEQKGIVVMTEEQKPPEKPASLGKRFVALRANECHFPIDDSHGHNMMCCAAPVLPNLPYCGYHYRIAYAKPSPRPRPMAVD